MPRGITEKDVFAACDSLVLAGERPTIERVRQKIGRGSPNTVSPMLDTWFKGLGRRLQDPGAFAPPSDVPEPVLQAAQHFWEVAQAGARADLQEQLTQRLGPMQQAVEQAVHAKSVAEAERDAECQRSAVIEQQLVDRAAQLEAERVSHSATAAREQSALAQVTELATKLSSLEALLLEAQARARIEVHAAQQRADGAERRAALEIENERAGQARADKRADALEKRVDALRTDSLGLEKEVSTLRASLAHQSEELARQREMHSAAVQQHEATKAALADAKLATERANAQAQTSKAALDRLLPPMGAAKKVPPRKAQTGRGAKQA